MKKFKKIIDAVFGFTVLAFGILLIVFLGPAFIVIPIGLSILATEFVWANRLLENVKNGFRKIFSK